MVQLHAEALDLAPVKEGTSVKPKSWDSSAASSALSTSHHSLAAQEAGQTHSRLSAMDGVHAQQLTAPMPCRLPLLTRPNDFVVLVQCHQPVLLAAHAHSLDTGCH